jgi:hypothetical protein
MGGAPDGGPVPIAAPTCVKRAEVSCEGGWANCCTAWQAMKESPKDIHLQLQDGHLIPQICRRTSQTLIVIIYVGLGPKRVIT